MRNKGGLESLVDDLFLCAFLLGWWGRRFVFVFVVIVSTVNVVRRRRELEVRVGLNGPRELHVPHQSQRPQKTLKKKKKKKKKEKGLTFSRRDFVKILSMGT